MDSLASARPTQWNTIARVVVFWLAYLAILFGLSHVKVLVPPAWGQLVWGLISGAAIFILSLCFLRREARHVRDIGLDFDSLTVLRMLLGFFIGIVVFGSNIAAVALFVAPLHFEWAAAIDPAAVGLVICTQLATSWMEELGFRGYALRTLLPSFTTWQAQAIVAVAFGLSHVAFGWVWSDIVLGVLPCGFLFGAVAMASRGVAMPTGVHAGLNFAQFSIGSRGSWPVIVADADNARISTLAPAIGAVCVLLASAFFWWWSRLHLRTGARDVCELPSPSSYKAGER
jgi:membrane protease YdiL (CAAX protease family)